MNMQASNKTIGPRLAALLFSAFPGIGFTAVIGETIGQAFDLNSDELLYSETHCVDPSGDSRLVIYRDDNEALIARKRVDYRSGRTTPSFVQHNLYSNQMIKVDLDDAGLLTMKIVDADKGEPIKVKSTAPTDVLPVVIDAGFDEFVRAHWDELVDGGKKTFLFPFAARSSLVELRIRPAQCSYQSESDQCFKLELSNWLFRMLASPIELGYDADTRRLTRYRGISNIGDGSGGGQEVDIQYRYQDLPSRVCQVEQPDEIESQASIERLLSRRDGSS